VNMTNDEEMGTIYSVAIPIKRIKPAVSPTRAAAALRAASAHVNPRHPAAPERRTGHLRACSCLAVRRLGPRGGGAVGRGTHAELMSAPP